MSGDTMKDMHKVVDGYTDDYMVNKRLTEDDVAKCREAIEYIRNRRGKIPRRSLGLLIEYDLPLADTDKKKVYK